MKQNDIKIQHVRNRVAEIYTKVTGSNLIGELMMAAGADSTNRPIDINKLCPKGITLTLTDEQWSMQFSVDNGEYEKLSQKEIWSLRIYNETAGIDVTVDNEAITGGVVEYDNGIVTVNNVEVGELGDTTTVSAKWSIEGVDYVPFFGLPVTVE